MVFVLVVIQDAYAQEKIAVRTGAHKGYSRIVIDWKKPVKYKINDSTPGKIVISFDRSATPDRSKVDLSKLANIKSLKVLTLKPLKISLKVSAGSKAKPSFFGKAFVLDVYDPVKELAKPKEEKAEAAKVQEAQAAPPVAVPEKKPEAKTAEPSAAEENQHERKTPPKPVEVVGEVTPPPLPSEEYKLIEVDENGDDKQKAVAQALAAQSQELESVLDIADMVTVPTVELPKIEPKKPEKIVVSLTSAEAIGMAVFQTRGDLWFVVDKPDFLLQPKVENGSGEYLASFEEIQLEDGKAFRTRFPPGWKMRGEGGNISWKIIFESGDAPEVVGMAKPREPIRQSTGMRGGKMLWPFEKASKVLDIKDPITGHNFKIVTVTDSGLFAGKYRDFVNFEVLESSVGMALRSKVDDLSVNRAGKNVEIARGEGLILSPERKVPLQSPEEIAKSQELAAARLKSRKNLLYKFADWRKGELGDLNKNKIEILSDIGDSKKEDRAEALIRLAKMNLAYCRGAEALAFLSFAEQEMPALGDTLDFIALRAIANTFDWKSEAAFADFLNSNFASMEEIKYWKAYVLADLGDWHQAGEILPKQSAVLYEYPTLISQRLGLVLAEVALRAGRLEQGEELLTLVGHNKDSLQPPMLATLKYLQGEAHRQHGERDKAAVLWKELSEGTDDMYRAKAGLALTRLLQEDKKITSKEAIDRLERLRYAWRGDELEAQILYWLGHTYFEEKEYVKGLTIMRDATMVVHDTELAHRIASEMAQTFSDIYLRDRLKDLSALDAVALYEQFSELIPTGEKGNQLAEVLAEHLVKADLLDRAASLIQHQIDHKLKGDKVVEIGIRLAVIRLLDKRPEQALQAIAKVTDTLRTLPPESITQDRVREILLLKCRAYSLSGKVEQALEILKSMPKSPEVNKLKADIAWKGGYWDEAADALRDVLADAKIRNDRALTPLQIDLIMNRLVMLHLADNRFEIDNMRADYLKLMSATPKAHQFEMLTRPRRSGELADRDTLMSIISEVDLFQEFLENYREDAKPIVPEAKVEEKPKDVKSKEGESAKGVKPTKEEAKPEEKNAEAAVKDKPVEDAKTTEPAAENTAKKE